MKGGIKMKKTKTQKGITLVALIITVVVLLILAAVTINSIQNDGIISKAQYVTNKFDESQKDEQSILDEYFSYLDPDSAAATELDLVERYILGADKTGRSALEIANVNAETGAFESFIDDPDSITDASTTVTYVYAWYNEDYTKVLTYLGYKNTIYKAVIDSTTFFSESVSYLYKENSNEIFEGSLALTAMERVPFSSKEEISVYRKYKLNVTINGESKVFYAQMQDNTYGDFVEVKIDGETAIVLLGNIILTTIDGVVLNGIYDVGLLDNYVEENEFGAWYIDGGWRLIKTPNTKYVVPETVGGNTISTVSLKLLSGEPTFERTVEFTELVEGMSYITGITFTTSDLDFVLDETKGVGMIMLRYCEYMDFSGCGDNIEFYDDLLEEIASQSCTVYVSSAVKAKYSDNTNIVAKS